MIPYHELSSLSRQSIEAKYDRDEIIESLRHLNTVGVNRYENTPIEGGDHNTSLKQLGISQYDHNQDFFSYKNLNALKDNLGPSAGSFFEGLHQAAKDPGSTYEALKEMGISGIVNELDQRYGSLNRIKETATEDPFGTGIDVAGLPFTGLGRGAAALKTAGTAVAATGGMGAKVAGMGIKGLGHAAEAVVDPLGTAIQGTWGAAKAAGQAGVKGLDVVAELTSAVPTAAARATRESSETLAGLRQLESTGKTWSWIPKWRPLKEYVADEDFVFDQYRVAIDQVEENIGTIMEGAYEAVRSKGYKSHINVQEIVDVINDLYPSANKNIQVGVLDRVDEFSAVDLPTKPAVPAPKGGGVTTDLAQARDPTLGTKPAPATTTQVDKIRFQPKKAGQAYWEVGGDVKIYKKGEAPVTDDITLDQTPIVVSEINTALSIIKHRQSDEVFRAYKAMETIQKNRSGQQGIDPKVTILVGKLREELARQVGRVDAAGNLNIFGEAIEKVKPFYKNVTDFRQVLGIPKDPIMRVDKAGTILNKLMAIMKSNADAEQTVIRKFKQLSGTNPEKDMLDPTKHGMAYGNLDPTAAAAGAYMRKKLPGNIVGRSMLWGALGLSGFTVSALFGIAMTSPAIMGRFLSSVGMATGVKNQIVDITTQLWKKPYVKDLAKRGYTLGGVMSQMAHREQLNQQKGSRR